MCGIVGCKLKRPLTPDDLARMRTLRDSIAYRGPDDCGEFYQAEKGLYLGHRRLSIIDLDPRSAQPMRDGKRTIAYNGEIYNYLELRNRLEAEVSFRTQSDTEVILKAWRKWGAEALQRFDGMFSFCLQEGDELHLATDIFGEKPLYLYQAPEGIYFCSEAQPLIKSFGLSLNDDMAIGDYLYLGFIRPPKTGYENLITLPPASHYRITAEGVLQPTTYWKPGKAGAFGVDALSDTNIDKVGDLLCQSLEKRLRSDVPMGLFLSGGVDSSLVAALAAKELGVDLTTFSVSFPDGDDESGYARNIASHLGLDHRAINSLTSDHWKRAPQAILDLYGGVPNDNMTALAVYQMCLAARPHITVALSGLGGDELFFGYNKYGFLSQNNWLYRLAPLVNRFGALPCGRVRKIQDIIAGDQNRQYLRLKNGRAQNVLEKAGFSPPEDLLIENETLLTAVNDFDCRYTLPQSQIPAIERASMRASMEIRTPFLNKALFEFVHSLDQASLIAHGQKEILKRLLSRYMPLDLLYPAKQGFIFPQQRFFEQQRFQVPSEIAGLLPEAFQKLIDPDNCFYAPRMAMRFLILQAAEKQALR